MPSSVISAVAPSVISAGASFLGNSLFGSGSKKPVAMPPPTGINAGGLTSTLSNGSIGITASPERMGFVNNIAGGFGNLVDELGLLRAKVAPGMSELRTSRLGEIEDARNRAVGDLRENLARRRVLGSSFGADALSRAESEFAGQRERVAAESTLQELEMTHNLINEQFNANRMKFQTGLDELNLQANIAAGLAGKATDTMAANARFEAALAAEEAKGAGKFFGQTFQPVADALGKSIGGGASNVIKFGSTAGSGFNGSGLPLAA